MSTGQLVRARRNTALRTNTVFVDDGRVLEVLGSRVIDVCPACGTEGAPIGILSDGSMCHLLPGRCNEVFR